MRLLASAIALTLGLLVACGSSNSSPDGGSGLAEAAAASTCSIPTGPGTTHEGLVTADERWTAAASPHVVTFDMTVRSGATLTLEPCAVVRIKKGYAIVAEGHLVAAGSALQPVDIGPFEEGQSWGYLQVVVPGTLSLAYTTVHGGGGQDVNALGMIEARGDQDLTAQPVLKVDHVSVVGSATWGVSLRGSGAFTVDSQALTITGSAKEAMRILPRLATNIPSGSYTGNAVNAILVETEAYGDVNLEDVTFHNRGVSYHVGGSYTFGTLRVGPNPVALTIEAGVTMAFSSTGTLSTVSNNGSTGAIVAAGSATQPIVFTSVSPTPSAGDWQGLVFSHVADVHSRLDHVEIRFAGAVSQASGGHCEPDKGYYVGDDAALTIFAQPASEFLTNSLIADSKTLGVDLAYFGDPVDFLASNQFVDVTSCKVSTPRLPSGACPDTIACP
jgi:hypothetical protein